MSFDYDEHFDLSLERLKDEGRYRVFANLERQAIGFPKALYRPNGEGSPMREVTMWCSNDYLNMSADPDVIATMVAELKRQGGGAGGTRNIAGTNVMHVQLEHDLAALHNKDAALLFSSGWNANETALNVLGQMPGCIIFSDDQNHASMIAGMRNSRALVIRFKHNDPEDLRRRLEQADDDERPKIIAFESVYSMDGDIAPIKEFVALAREFNALTYLDEVHAVGLYGPTGAGVAERDGVMDQIDLVQGTLAKGFGLVGGYVAGKRNLIDYIRSHGAGFIFSTSMPPHLAAGACASIHLVKGPAGSSYRDAHFQSVARVKAMLKDAGFPVLDNNSHIVPLMIGDPVLCKLMSDALLNHHDIYIQPINYPTVPKGTERLRITPTRKHYQEHAEKLVAALIDCWDKIMPTPRRVGSLNMLEAEAQV